MTEDISISQHGAWGLIRLTRPKALNALTEAMCAAMLAAFRDWREDDSVQAVLIEGEGEKAFCAGGDIRWLYDTAKQDPAAAAEFFRTEYTNNAQMFSFPKPIVALMDGVTMGGGVGISAPARFRVASDRTLWAMPETGIGLFPDVGGSYYLSRLGAMGLYIGLTGSRLDGHDLVATGLATHYTPAESMGDLRETLLAMADPAENGVAATLGRFHRAGDSALAADAGETDRLLQDVPSLSALFDRLRTDGNAFAEQTLATLERMSPTSMAITLEAWQRGAAMSFNDVLEMEFAVASHLMASHDFIEGVRAQIIDKDRNPQWQPDHVDAVTPALTDRFFAPLENAPLRLAS